MVGGSKPGGEAVTASSVSSIADISDRMLLPTDGTEGRASVAGLLSDVLASSFVEVPEGNSLLDNELRELCVNAGGRVRSSRESEGSSIPGGGIDKSNLLVLAAYATASAPYGTPNLAKLSLEEISNICSGVGPDRGYEISVRVRVCERGALMEWREIVDGDVRCTEDALSVLRDMLRKSDDPPPDCEGRCARRVRSGEPETEDARDGREPDIPGVVTGRTGCRAAAGLRTLKRPRKPERRLPRVPS